MWCAAFAPMPEALEIVRAVRVQATTAILTNNGPVLLDALRHDLAEVSCDVDHLFLSAQFGATKPSPVVFAGVSAELQVPASEILLVDDTLRNVDGARVAGWRSVHFVSALDLVIQLRALGLNV
jgi:HAD superfamily hydrolase (TIGR01509 family)